jgi:hypothetical protein
MRPPLGLENRRHRLGILRIGANAINRLGPKRDQFSAPQHVRRTRNIAVRAIKYFRQITPSCPRMTASTI